jgi:hypothetical protein
VGPVEAHPEAEAELAVFIGAVLRFLEMGFEECGRRFESRMIWAV